MAALREIRDEVRALTGSAAVEQALKNDQIAAVVNELRDIAVEYHDTQQLRGRLSRVVVPLLKSLDRAQAVADIACQALKLNDGAAAGRSTRSPPRITPRVALLRRWRSRGVRKRIAGS